MMKQILALAAVFLLGTTIAFAQTSNDTARSESPSSALTEWSINIFGTSAFHDVDFNSLPPIENCCLGFDNSTGIGYGVQLGGSFPLSNNGLRLSTRVGYQLLPAAYSSFSTQPVFDRGIGGDVDAVFKHGLDLTFHTVPVHVTLEHELTDWLWIGVGPDAYYIVSTEFRQTEMLEFPTNLMFENGSRTRIDTTSSLSGYNTIVFNVHGSLRVRLLRNIGMIRGIDLNLGYTYPLTSVFDPQTWQGSTGRPPRSYFINRYNISLLTAGIAVTL